MPILIEKKLWTKSLLLSLENDVYFIKKGKSNFFDANLNVKKDFSFHTFWKKKKKKWLAQGCRLSLTAWKRQLISTFFCVLRSFWQTVYSFQNHKFQNYKNYNKIPNKYLTRTILKFYFGISIKCYFSTSIKCCFSIKNNNYHKLPTNSQHFICTFRFKRPLAIFQSTASLSLICQKSINDSDWRLTKLIPRRYTCRFLK